MKLTVSQGKRLFHCLAIDQYMLPLSYLPSLLQKSNYTEELLTINRPVRSGKSLLRGPAVTDVADANMGTHLASKESLSPPGPFTFLFNWLY